jgi:hypothetical protein
MNKKTLVLAVPMLIGSVGASWGQVVLDPLHGCIIGTACFDNGTVTPTTTNALPNFTFTASSGPLTGDWLIDILVPNNATNANSLSFSISGTKGGPGDNTPIPATGATFKGDWTSGQLDNFLGTPVSGASPPNPIDAWRTYTQGNNCGPAQNATCDPGATGYAVYQVDLGQNELQSPSNPVTPILTLSGSGLPVASVLTSFLLGVPSWGNIGTASSGGIFEATDAPPPVPEPSSIILLGTMLLGAGRLLKKKGIARV